MPAAWRGGMTQVRLLSLSDHGDTTWPGNSQDKRRNYLTRRDIQTFCAAFQTLHVGDQRCHYKEKKGAFTGHSQAMISWVRMGTRPLVPLNGCDAPRGGRVARERWASGGRSSTSAGGGGWKGWACQREAERGATSSLRGWPGVFVRRERIRRPCRLLEGEGGLTCRGKKEPPGLEEQRRPFFAGTNILCLQGPGCAT